VWQTETLFSLLDTIYDVKGTYGVRVMLYGTILIDVPWRGLEDPKALGARRALISHRKVWPPMCRDLDMNI
jgi:hypothetical protein